MSFRAQRGILGIPVEGAVWVTREGGPAGSVGQSHVRQSVVVGHQFSVPVPSDWD